MSEQKSLRRFRNTPFINIGVARIEGASPIGRFNSGGNWAKHLLNVLRQDFDLSLLTHP
jgi:hypothetical protein